MTLREEASIVNCPNCQYTNPDSARFCSHCGIALAAADFSEPPHAGAARPCTNCGSRLPAGAPTCPVCGAAAIEPVRPAAAPGGAQPRPVRPTGAAPSAVRGDAGVQSSFDPDGRHHYYVDLTGEEPAESAPAGRRSSRPAPIADREAPPRRGGYRYRDDFGGDLYSDGRAEERYTDYDDGYDEAEPYDDYAYSKPRRNVPRMILTATLALLSLVVVIGIISVVRQLVNHPPLTTETQTAASTTPSTQTTTAKPTTVITTTPITKPPTTTTQPPTTTTTAETTLAPGAVVVTITAGDGYVLRSGPGTNYDRMGLAAHNNSVQVIGTVTGQAVEGIGDQWYQVLVNGQTLYMIKDPAGQK